ncbi:hypothetical protein BH10PLA2_BH10PLA2_19090 [soil metagenome]
MFPIVAMCYPKAGRYVNELASALAVNISTSRLGGARISVHYLTQSSLSMKKIRDSQFCREFDLVYFLSKIDLVIKRANYEMVGNFSLKQT